MNRLVAIDNIACLMILHMIIVVHAANICHVEGILVDFLMNTLVCFLPWFFFKAGMFFNINKSFREELTNGWNRLIIPFFIYSLLGWLIIILGGYVLYRQQSLTNVLQDTIHCFFWYGSIRGNAALWFLLSLFLCRITFCILMKLKIPMFVIICCSLLLAALINLLHLNFPYYIGNVSNGLFFFSLGYILKDLQYNKILFTITTLIIAYQLYDPIYLDFRSNSLFTDKNYLQVELYCISDIIFLNNIFKHYIHSRIPLFTHIGENTMIYYLPHYFILLSVNEILSNFHVNSAITFVISLLILVISLYIFKSGIKVFHLEWTTGIK